MAQPSVVPQPLSSWPSDPDGYRFPDHRLRLQLSQPDRIPLVLVAPGSFSPITFLHLRMFEMAADYVRLNTNFELIGGYLTPVSDSYRKKGLAPHEHRLQMCELAAAQTSKWLMVDRWEATQPSYMRTALVLKHFEHELKRKYPNTAVHIALLAGADLVQTMSQPGVWDPEDLSLILGKFGLFVVERDSTDMNLALAGLPQGANVNVIPQVFINNMSSTQVRLHLQRKMSVRYLIPDCVIDYIEQHGLYQKDDNKEAERKDLRAITSSDNGDQIVSVAPVTGS